MTSFGRSSSVKLNVERSYSLVKYTDLRLGSNVVLDTNLLLTIDKLRRVLTISHSRQIIHQVPLIATAGRNSLMIRALLESSSIFISAGTGSGDLRFRFRTVPSECAEILRQLQEFVNIEIVKKGSTVQMKLNPSPQHQLQSDFSQSQNFFQSTQDCFTQSQNFHSSGDRQIATNSQLSSNGSNSQLSTLSSLSSTSSLNSIRNFGASSYPQSSFIPPARDFLQDIKDFDTQLSSRQNVPTALSQPVSINITGSANMKALQDSFSSLVKQEPTVVGDAEQIDFNSMSDEALKTLIQEQLKKPEFRQLVDRVEKMIARPLSAGEQGIPMQFNADSTPVSTQAVGIAQSFNEKPSTSGVSSVPYAPRFTVPSKQQGSQSLYSQSQTGDNLLKRLEALQDNL